MKISQYLKKAVALSLIVFSLCFAFVNPSYAACSSQIDFTQDWQENLTSEVIPGGTLTINYDANRLPERRTYYKGLPTWQVKAGLQFENDGAVKYIDLREGQNDFVSPQIIAIPKTAKKVTIWFENSGYNPYDTPEQNQAIYYDSAYGDNYNFPVAEESHIAS